MLQVEHLICGYGGAPVVRDVSFRVGQNEKLCILGPNGCGKTTLLRAVCGMLASEGTIMADGVDIKTAKRHVVAKKMALMSQMTSTYFAYTVYETVMLGRYTHQKRGVFGAPAAKDRAIVEESMARTGVLDMRDKLITELSGGQLQRVFLARIFAQDPQIILLDEPTNHLDLRYQLELILYLKEWAQQDGRCVVGVLHDINLALSFADSILLMQQGRVVAHQAVNDFDISLLGEIYQVDIRTYMKQSLKRWEYAYETVQKPL